MTKIETIRNIKDINSLTAVMINIAEKSGLKDVVKSSENIISCSEIGAFKRKEIKIICTLSELSGKVPQISINIKQYSNEDNDIIIVSSHKKKISEYFKSWIKKDTNTTKIEFWGEDDLIKSIDRLLPDYWGHSDLFLKSYEDSFIQSLTEETDLKKILKLDRKFEELLNVFIEPKIYYNKEDAKTDRKIKIKININHFLKYENFFISGDAGTGKTTLLKEIGKKAIQKNLENGTKFLPILIKNAQIALNHFSINDTIDSIFTKKFDIEDINKVFEDYHVLLLIDSIDELERNLQKSILDELKDLVDNNNVNFILCTRNYDNLTKDCNICKHNNTYLSNFDLEQVKKYIDNFFRFDLVKSDQLWSSLLDNKILERIPVTPLTISLLSILYEENGYEVPATLTDVYDNFNIFLLGRTNVKNRLEFLEISVKEKILSMYALFIIETPNRLRKTEKEFIEYIIDFFKNQSITIEEDLVPELIISLTEGTGIIYIDESSYVTFKHDHFLEYYASIEMFNSFKRQSYEDQLIDKFTEYNWQNAAIFFAGRTKHMPEFLNNLNKRMYKYNTFEECLLAISGMGYLLQALWMTDSIVRKDSIIASLELLIKADSKVKELALSKFNFFEGINDFFIALMNLSWFYYHFNSKVLKDPLTLAFEHLYNELKTINDTCFEKDKTTKLYQLFCVASTLNTGRTQDSSKLEKLFEEDKILTNPLFVYLFDDAMSILEFSNEKKMREEYKIKSKKNKYLSSIRFYLDNPAEELRFTTFEKLNQIKKVEIYTEGKTDAIIINHAFKVLTYNLNPYWNITGMEKLSTGGGATEVAKHIEKISKLTNTEYDNNKIIFGLFDNDTKGFQEFNGLDKDFLIVNKIIKKHKNKNIFAMLLPIPEEDYYKPYHQDKQNFKFFSIEHYFSKELLLNDNMITQTPIPDVYEVTGNKNDFASEILKNYDYKVFKHFINLFNEIDNICKKEYNYLE